LRRVQRRGLRGAFKFGLGFCIIGLLGLGGLGFRLILGTLTA
jgi:hypothetical protein